MKKIVIIVTIAFISLFSMNLKAQTASDLLPCDQYNTSVFDACGDVNSQVTSVIQVGISVAFVLIILYGIFLIIKAALTIIRSNGDPSQLESGVNMIRGVYIGIGIIFIGIIGLVIVIAFFGAGGILNTTVNTPGNIVIPIITN